MNYSAHYDRLISRARHRVLQGYRERHHVLARCMGGSAAPANIVELTAEEHYVAHQLLVKMYPNNAGLIRGAVLLSVKSGGNKAFGWLRRRSAETMIGNRNRRGTRASAETRAKMSAARLGRPRSPETIAKMSVALRGIPKSLEHRKQMSVTRRGRKQCPQSPEHRAKIGMAHRGKVVSQETRAKLSLATRAHYQLVSEATA